MCENKKNPSVLEPVVFLDKTIKDKKEDVLGSFSDAVIISKAIDGGAEMIAVTSSFGAGKSSIIDLMTSYRKEQDKKEEVVKVSMWSQICNNRFSQGNGDNETYRVEMHKNLLYQICSQLSLKKGSYIIQKLSPDYGVLKAQVKDQKYKYTAFVGIILLVLLWINEHLYQLLPVCASSNVAKLLISLVAVFLIILAIFNSEIIYSSHNTKQQKDKSIEELIDIFKNALIEAKVGEGNNRERIIVVVEDLDRTDNTQAVKQFLIQLRRFYIDSRTKTKNAVNPDVVFIVCLKNESCALEDSYIKENNEKLYEKIFDYIYDLSEINYIDYEFILTQLIEQKRGEIEALGLLGQGQAATNIDGIDWITYGENLSMRLIKDRLNRSLSKYITLKNRFGLDTEISYTKCAAAAYVVTTYEEDFYKTDSNLFDDLIDAYITNELDQIIADYDDQRITNLGNDYLLFISNLIKDGIIDEEYRLYYYNYPWNSRVLNRDERIVQAALLHKKTVDSLEESVEAVKNSHSRIINESFEKLHRLGTHFPQIVFENEILYVEALRGYDDKVYEWLEGLGYSAEGIEKSAESIIRILNYDKSRNYYNEGIIEHICRIIVANANAEELLVLRGRICKYFPEEISLYKTLFVGTTPIISKDEIRSISVNDATLLINQDHAGFDISYLSALLNEINNGEKYDINLLSDFFRSTLDTIEQETGDNSKAIVYIDFMKTTRCHDRLLASYVVNWENCIERFNQGKTVTEGLQNSFNEVIKKYTELINLLAAKDLDGAAIINIVKLMSCDKINWELTFGESVIPYINVKEHGLVALYIYLKNEKAVPFNSSWVFETVNNSIEKITSNKKYFYELRWQLIRQKSTVITKYKLLFSDKCPIITKPELNALGNNTISDRTILSLVPASLIDENNAVYIAEFFSNRKQNNLFVKDYFSLISGTESAVAELLLSLSDFSNIPYYKLPKKTKSKIKTAVEDSLSLNDETGMLHFMKYTKSLDAEFEVHFDELIKTDEAFRKEYFAIVNSTLDETINAITVHVICQSPRYYDLNDKARNALYASGEYKWYVVSGILHNDWFAYEKTKKENLWDTYAQLLLSDLETTTEKMLLNKEFITDAMDEQVFKRIEGQNESKRMRFAKVNQTKESLDEVYEYYSNAFCIQYFSEIAGFRDESAAMYFVEIVERDSDILKSDKVFKNTYEKLLNGTLRMRYTRARRKEGLESGWDFYWSLFKK